MKLESPNANFSQVAWLRLPAEFGTADAELSVDLFVQLVGYSAIKKCVKDQADKVARNQMLERYFLSQHYIGIDVFELLEHRKKTGRFPLQVQSPEHYRTITFCHIARHIWNSLRTTGSKNRLKGMLRDALLTPKGQLSLLHEFSTIGHLANHGWEICLNDIDGANQNGQGKFDILARQNECELEIECKYVSSDLGRKVHKLEFHDFIGQMIEIVGFEFGKPNGTTVVDVIIPKRLNRLDYDGYIDDIKNCTRSLAPATHSTINISSFDRVFEAPDDGVISEASLREYLAQLGFDEQSVQWSHTAMFGTSEANKIFILRSAKDDAFIDSLYEMLRAETKKKFSESRPAALIVHIDNLSQDQLVSIAQQQSSASRNPNRLYETAEKLFTKRPFLHSIVFMVRGQVMQEEGGTTATYTERSRPYVIRNKLHPLAESPTLRIFG